LPARSEPGRRAGRYISNTLVQFAAPGARMLLGVVLAAALSRYLGLAGFGEYVLVFAYVATFGGIFNDWGLGTICLREISRRPADRAHLIASASALQGLVALGSYLLMVLSLVFLHYPSRVVWAIALYGTSMLFTPLDVLALLFQAELRLDRLLAPSLLGVGSNFVLTIAVILQRGPLLALVGAALASLVLQYAWVALLSLRALGFGFRPSARRWGFLLREAWPLGLATVVSTALQQAPLLALSVVSLEGVGLFNAANRIPQQLVLLPLAVRTTLFPLLSRAWVEDRPRFIRLVQALIACSLLVAIPVTIAGIGMAQPAMRLLFGSAFTGAGPSFTLLLIGNLALLFPGILLGEALIVAGFQRLNLWILVATLPLLLALLLVLVPLAGATGAAVAVLASYAAIVSASAVTASRRLGPVISLRMVGQWGLAALVGATTLLLSAGHDPWIWGPIAGLLALITLGVQQRPLVRQLWGLRAFGPRWAR
jgi:O-antigen/teichoic acid export membrane protein